MWHGRYSFHFKRRYFVGGLLAMKSEDHIFCSLLIQQKSASNTLFPAAKNCLLFTEAHTFSCKTENRFCCVCSLQCQQCRNTYSRTPESSILFPCIITSKIELGASAPLTFWFLISGSNWFWVSDARILLAYWEGWTIMSAVVCAQNLGESEPSFGESGIWSLSISLPGVKGWGFCLGVDLPVG